MTLKSVPLRPISMEIRYCYVMICLDREKVSPQILHQLQFVSVFLLGAFVVICRYWNCRKSQCRYECFGHSLQISLVMDLSSINPQFEGLFQF